MRNARHAVLGMQCWRKVCFAGEYATALGIMWTVPKHLFCLISILFEAGFRGALAKWQEFFLGSATLPQPLMPCKEAPGILDVGLAAILKPILCKVLVIYLAIASCVFETNTAQCVSLP